LVEGLQTSVALAADMADPTEMLRDDGLTPPQHKGRIFVFQVKASLSILKRNFAPTLLYVYEELRGMKSFLRSILICENFKENVLTLSFQYAIMVSLSW
jgi:hypothetical protein